MANPSQSQLKEAISTALNLSPSETTLEPHGGSGFSSTFKLTCGDKRFFVKTGVGSEAEVMFRGEFESLNAINSAVPELCPKALAHGQVGESGQYFLATEFLDIIQGNGKEEDGLAVKLAKLHSIPAPEGGRYGFPVTTCCGSTPQDNTYSTTWSSFFTLHRLLPILQSCIKSKGPQPDLSAAVNRILPIANYLLSKLSPTASIPVVVHGDLWSGNAATGTIHNRVMTSTAVVFDPSSCYAPAEYDHGIMNCFSGFGKSFWSEYETELQKIRGEGKGEPVGQYEDRVQLYMLYHYLNHYALFGMRYKQSAMDIMERLWMKYGDITWDE